MELISFIADGDRKRQLAVLTRSSEGYLWQIATGWRNKRASPGLALEIERATALIGPETVSKSELRPDIWPATTNDSEAA